MNYNPQAITVSLKTCPACGTSLVTTYRFCRLCGANQSQLGFVTRRHDSISNPITTTKVLAAYSERNALLRAGRYRSISGSVLDSFVTSELTAATSRIKSRTAKRAVAAAITIPLWLIIVLLSPIEALHASNQVTREL